MKYMRKIKIADFRTKFYVEGSGPSLSALRVYIRANKLPGGLIEYGHYYVDLDEYEVGYNLRTDMIRQLVEASRNPRLKGLIN
jgi:hypothetical protein